MYLTPHTFNVSKTKLSCRPVTLYVAVGGIVKIGEGGPVMLYLSLPKSKFHGFPTTDFI